MVESQMLEQIDAHSRQWKRGSPFCRAQNFNFIIIIFPGCHPRRSCPWHGWEGRHVPTGMVCTHTHTHIKLQWIHEHAAHTCSVHKNLCMHNTQTHTLLWYKQKPTPIHIYMIPILYGFASINDEECVGRNTHNAFWISLPCKAHHTHLIA